jgi:uncharacterized membrane protein YjjP (DUF1212 family)
VPASRLEGAVQATARALEVSAEIWSAPTGILLSLGDATRPQEPQTTRVLRLEPGNMDLAALVVLNEIADKVIERAMPVSAALAALQALDAPPSRNKMAWTIVAFAIAAAAVAGLLRTSWLDIAVSGVLGLVIGVLAIASRTRPNLAAASEAVAALVATVLVAAFAHFVAPLSVQTVIIAALIVLMPGLTLTTAVAELASQQLVTGTTRFAGALVVLLKLIFGSVAGTQLVGALGWTPRQAAATELSVGVEVVALLAAAFSFAILFNARRGDVPLVTASAVLGYVLTRIGGMWLGVQEVQGPSFAGGVFFSSLVIAALANAYGRFHRRPGALVRVPGIMLMVPGSVGFRTIASLIERDYALGLDTGVVVLSALIALMAGLLFGSLLVPPRRYL